MLTSFVALRVFIHLVSVTQVLDNNSNKDEVHATTIKIMEEEHRHYHQEFPSLRGASDILATNPVILWTWRGLNGLFSRLHADGFIFDNLELERHLDNVLLTDVYDE